jgi:hypothetical protein
VNQKIEDVNFQSLVQQKLDDLKQSIQGIGTTEA